MTIKELFTSTSPYMWGIIAILILYVISGFVTRPENEPGQARGLRFNLNPFALAIGDDKNLSASLLQFLIFTYLTIFAYVTVYAARLGSGLGLTMLPDIPLNLLILMGLSV